MIMIPLCSSIQEPVKFVIPFLLLSAGSVPQHCCPYLLQHDLFRFFLYLPVNRIEEQEHQNTDHSQDPEILYL